MINGIRVKVCGVTSLVDAEAAATCGADFLGFILYPKSPRFVSLEAFQAMRPGLPAAVKKVGVLVEPTLAELAQARDAGFDYIQLHFPNATTFPDAVAWLDVVPPAQLWLAPRIPPGDALDLMFVALADTMVFDTYHPEQIGGTGETGDWKTFAKLQTKNKDNAWVLAGGLTPENIVAAIRDSRAHIVDVNSGVEISPGVKDHARLRAFFAALESIQSAQKRRMPAPNTQPA
jgi:phosphoribosylanthranilate isomerase